jgi:Reverse transcriptase (RNA-dependent DNA polymerase)
MFSATEQFITQMKFRELQIQRDNTLAAYEALQQELAAAQDDHERLRILYTGLRSLKFANQRLHPDVANLELILQDADTSRTSSGTMAYWIAELERELARGRLRSEIVYIFGALLEEWASENPQAQDDDGAHEAEAALIAGLSDAGARQDHTDFLKSLFEKLPLPGVDELARRIRRSVDENVYVRVFYMQDSNSDLESILDRIKDDPFRSDAIRSQAARFRLNPTLMKELSDALTILIDHLEEWDWPEGGVPTHAVWAHNKWRLFLAEDLPTACLLELLGTRWSNALETAWEDIGRARVERLQRLLELNAPAIIIENERRLAEPNLTSAWRANTDIWAESPEHAEGPSSKASQEDLSNYWGESTSIYSQRAVKTRELSTLERLGSYSSDGLGEGLQAAMNLTNAEVQLGRAAFPDRPLYVVKMDIRNFYPSLPHDVILGILERYGLAERELAFFRRYLGARISRDSGPLTTQVGMPNHRILSDLLGEAVLSLLDRYVRRQARVQIIRIVDDICCIAASPDEAVKTWQAVQSFCAGCGLEVNDEKCGAVCIGGELPASLPTRNPRWQLLSLDEQGQWTVDEETFAAYIEETRRQMARTSSTIARARLYNSSLAYLEQSFGHTVALGQAHRASISSATRRFHTALFGDDQGIADTLFRDIQARFSTGNATIPIPDAWLYWPITAGGLGLKHAMLRAASYAENFSQRRRVVPPTDRAPDWQRRANEWSAYYTSSLEPIKQVETIPNKVMETLVTDFISRGADLSHGKQKTLSAYWRWILYLFGPQILDAFGTFRFLFSELVPLQLIIARQSGDDDTLSVDGETGEDAI